MTESVDGKKRECYIKDFILGPIGIQNNIYQKRGNDYFENNVKIGQWTSPSFMLSKLCDKRYGKDLYPFLCDFSHCNFGLLDHYLNDQGWLHYQGKREGLLCKLVVVFCFEKLIESIITIKGEEFDTEYLKNSYYDLVYDSLELEKRVFDFLIEKYELINGYYSDLLIHKYFRKKTDISWGEKISQMLCKMKDSLDDEIGDVNKNVYKNGKYERTYPW